MWERFRQFIAGKRDRASDLMVRSLSGRMSAPAPEAKEIIRPDFVWFDFCA